MPRICRPFRLENASIRSPLFPSIQRTKSLFSKRSLLHVARVMGPTILALAFAGVANVAHAQGTMDFSGAQTLMGTFKTYLNKTLIPALCKKAGVPLADVRGNITSHRARSTIASQLYNAREPMTLFELQEWLGHSSPHATQHYAKITPLKIAKSYADAGYFARNLRAIEVLVDQDVVRSGRAATEPWKFYDLGHGYCTYDFFDQYQHRMACAKCDFYMPKESTAALLLEGKTHLLHLLQEIPLGEAEQAAVEDGVAAYESLLSKLTDVPTPAGRTPRQIGAGLVQITSVRPALPTLTQAEVASTGVVSASFRRPPHRAAAPSRKSGA